MASNSIFYFPYGSFTEKQSPLLKTAAIYFDKLYILDPEKASGGSIGIDDPDLAKDISLLESKEVQILERVNPEDVVQKYERAIANAVHDDMNDPEFLGHCSTSEKRLWTLALAKVPKDIREKPKYQPKDQAMQRLMGDLPRRVARDVVTYDETYVEVMHPILDQEFVYDELRESDREEIEFRYADFPIEIGESIMINHALFSGLLHSDATPLSDDEFHHKSLEIKIKRAREIPELGKILDDMKRGDQIREAMLASRAIQDRQLDLPIIRPDQPLEEILNYRLKNKDVLEETRAKLAWLARSIKEQPWTREFDEKIHRSVIPKEIRPLLQENEKARNSWLKLTGMGLAATAATAQLFVNPMPLLSVPTFLAVMALVGGHATTLAEEILDWKKQAAKSRGTGLHYLLKYEPAQ
jgi:hypothetical protein